MDPGRFLAEIVKPTIDEYEADPTSVRRAFLACAATFHTVDWLAHPGKPAALRQKFRNACPEFAIVDDIEHAFKHTKAGKSDDPRLRASEVVTRPPASWGVAVWDISRWDDAAGGVTLLTDTNVDLVHVLRRAYAFLSAEAKPNE